MWHQWGMFFFPTDFTYFHRFGYMLSVFICIISGKCSFLPRISLISTDLVTCYPCSFVASVGNIFPPTDFHRFARIWLHVIRVHLCHQWGMFFSPTDFTDFTDLVTCYPCPFVTSVGNVLFSHGFSRIFTDLVTCYPCSFVASVGNIFLPRISQISTDLVKCYPCPFVTSVGNIFPPTDFTDFHRFGYMLSVFICGISGKCSFLPRISLIFTDLVTCYLCPFVLSVGNIFLPRISLICTDLIINYPWVLCLWVK